MDGQRTTAQKTLLLITSVGPCGYLPASGTATVFLVGLPLMYWMHTWPLAVRIVVTVVFTGLSIWLHDVGDRLLEEKDSRRLVWDELAGFMVAVVALDVFTWQLAAWAFFLERGIDILKVPPANLIEKHWPGGWGVVGDDVVAGLYTCGLLALLMHFAPPLAGL